MMRKALAERLFFHALPSESLLASDHWADPRSQTLKLSMELEEARADLVAMERAMADAVAATPDAQSGAFLHARAAAETERLRRELQRVQAAQTQREIQARLVGWRWAGWRRGQSWPPPKNIASIPIRTAFFQNRATLLVFGSIFQRCFLSCLKTKCIFFV